MPEKVRVIDAGAGVISEAKAAGASLADIRDLAGQPNLTATDRYMQSREKAEDRVVKLRQEKPS